METVYEKPLFSKFKQLMSKRKYTHHKTIQSLMIELKKLDIIPDKSELKYLDKHNFVFFHNCEVRKLELMDL